MLVKISFMFIVSQCVWVLESSWWPPLHPNSKHAALGAEFTADASSSRRPADVCGVNMQRSDCKDSNKYISLSKKTNKQKNHSPSVWRRCWHHSDMTTCFLWCEWDLNQKRHGAALIDLQDFSVLCPQQDVTVTQSDGSDGRVVLQQQTWGTDGDRETPCENNLRVCALWWRDVRPDLSRSGDTFGRRRQSGSLDGVRLQTSLKHVIPQLHDAVLPPRHETLDSERNTGNNRHTDHLLNHQHPVGSSELPIMKINSYNQPETWVCVWRSTTTNN